MRAARWSLSPLPAIRNLSSRRARWLCIRRPHFIGSSLSRKAKGSQQSAGRGVFIRSSEQREILFDLENARRHLFDLHGKTLAFDQVSKCSANLLRMWADD